MKDEKTAVETERESVARDAVSRALRALWDGLLYALWGYALSLCALPFGTQPLGLGLLCAANVVFVVHFVKTAFRRLALDCMVRHRSHQRDYTHSQE